MNPIYKLLLIGAVAAGCGASASAQNTTRLSVTKANDYALVYTLPVTNLSVTLEAEITVKKPGEFYKYAKKYLNINDPITKESRTATLKSAVVSTFGLPDADQRYAVQFKSGTDAYMMLSSANVPLAVNTTKVAPAEMVSLPEAQPAPPTPLETTAARQVVSEEMMQSQSTAKRAELAASALFAIRQTRADLISGQAEQMPPDGKSLQLMLDNLEAQEKALMAMFVGTTAVSTDVATFNLCPEGDVKHKVLARISPVDGIVDASDLSGEPVYIDVEVTQRGEMPVNEKGQQLVFPKNGFAYCIPGMASVAVSYDGRTYADRDEEFAQFGVVYGLNPNSFTNRKAPLYVVFDPATGAILEQGVASE